MNEYISNLIERNQNVISNINNENDKKTYLNNLIWASNLNQRLSNLDYSEREQALEKIKEVLNNDYLTLAGGVLEEEIVKGRSI